MEQKRKPLGSERYGNQRKQFESNKKKILASQDCCGICGRPVDKSLKYPHPMSPCIDHIVPIAKGGHPSDITNLQLSHWTCNRAKSDHLPGDMKHQKEEVVVSNRILPHLIDWTTYQAN